MRSSLLMGIGVGIGLVATRAGRRGLRRVAASPAAEAMLIGVADGYLERARAAGHPAIQALDARRAGKQAAAAQQEDGASAPL